LLKKYVFIMIAQEQYSLIHNISHDIGYDLFGYISSLLRYSAYVRYDPITQGIVTQIWVNLKYDYERTT
jgi:hypothetical protein